VAFATGCPAVASDTVVGVPLLVAVPEVLVEVLVVVVGIAMHNPLLVGPNPSNVSSSAHVGASMHTKPFSFSRHTPARY